MIENPFIITEKVIPKYFCDRKNESEEMIRLLTNGNNVVLISGRRIGKTGLIQFCFEKPLVKKNYITVFVDILSTSNLQEFTYLLGREVFSAVKTGGMNVLRSFLEIVKSISGKIGFDPISGLPTFNLQLGDISRPEYTLKEIFQYLSKAPKPVIVAIDEFQQIANYPEKKVEALIRSHLLDINNVRMIFSGSERHILAEMFSSGSRPFYQSASIMELPAIDKDIYVEFIRRMFKAGNKDITEELAERIYDRFDGVTFYVQRICNGLYSATEEGSATNERILELTLAGILSSYSVIYRMRLSRITLRQKELLLAIAKEGKVEKITSVEFIRKYSLSSASAVQTALKSLMKSELVVKAEDGYVIDDLFLRLWLNRNY